MKNVSLLCVGRYIWHSSRGAHFLLRSKTQYLIFKEWFPIRVSVSLLFPWMWEWLNPQEDMRAHCLGLMTRNRMFKWSLFTSACIPERTVSSEFICYTCYKTQPLLKRLIKCSLGWFKLSFYIPEVKLNWEIVWLSLSPRATSILHAHFIQPVKFTIKLQYAYIDMLVLTQNF